MPGYQGFKSSTKQESPRYYEAAIADEQAKEAARQQQFMEMVSAAHLYNQAMGDKTPLADWLRSLGNSSTPAAQTGAQTTTQTGTTTGSTLGSGGASGGGGTLTGGLNTGSTAGGSTAGGSTAGGSTAGGATAGGATAGGSTAGAGGGGAYSAGGFWPALLAAAVYANERDAKSGGYRRKGSDYWQDILNVRQGAEDIGERFPDKIGMKWGEGDTSQGFKKVFQGASSPSQIHKTYKGTRDLAKQGFSQIGNALRKLV